MFGLTLVDHLRLTFGHIIHTHGAHTRLALRHARMNRGVQLAEALCLIASVAASVAFLQTGQSGYGVAAVAAATLALVVLVVRVLFDFDRRAGAHRACGAHLWWLREQYRALLADLQDGHITIEAARERRDALMQRLHELYESAPPIDRTAYEAARGAVPPREEATLSDEEVDRFLPESLKKDDKSAA